MPNQLASAVTITPVSGSQVLVSLDHAQAGGDIFPSANLIFNPNLRTFQRTPVASPSAGEYFTDRWASLGGLTVDGNVVTLTSEKSAIIQVIEDVDVPHGGNLLASLSFTALYGSPEVGTHVLGWTGTANKPNLVSSINLETLSTGPHWDLTDGLIDQTYKNIALVVFISGSIGDQVALSKIHLGETAKTISRPYEIEKQLCSRFHQNYSVDFSLNTYIGFGATKAGNESALMLPLTYPIRGADGGPGTSDVSVQWGGAGSFGPSGRWWLYAGGTAVRFNSAPVLTCVHRHFLEFSVSANLAQNQPARFRPYQSTSVDVIVIDAELKHA